MVLKRDPTLTAEQEIIGGMLLRPELYHDLHELHEQLFRDHVCRRLYAAMNALWERAIVPDPITIEDWTHANKGAALSWDHMAPLTELIGSTHRNWGVLVDLLKEAHIDRQVRLIARGLAQSNARGDELLAEAMSAFNAVGNTRATRDAVPLDHAVRDLMQRAERLQSGGAPDEILTGERRLDDLGLLYPGGVLTIAGRTSMGKSAFVEFLISKWLEQGERVLLFSTESSIEKVARRFMARASGLNSRHIARGNDSMETWHRMADGAAKLHGLPLYIDDARTDKEGVVRAIRRNRKTRRISIVVLDHIGRCIPNKEPRVETNQLISAVQAVCKEEPRVGCVLVAQLSRRTENRESKRPALADLKESGNIEEDSAVVLLVFRPGYYRRVVTAYKDSDPNVMWLIAAKNRDGPTGSIAAAWDDGRGQVLGILSRQDQESMSKHEEAPE